MGTEVVTESNYELPILEARDISKNTIFSLIFPTWCLVVIIFVVFTQCYYISKYKHCDQNVLFSHLA